MCTVISFEWGVVKGASGLNRCGERVVVYKEKRELVFLSWGPKHMLGESPTWLGLSDS